MGKDAHVLILGLMLTDCELSCSGHINLLEAYTNYPATSQILGGIITWKDDRPKANLISV